MTKIEVLMCDLNLLRSREERAARLKDGFPCKDIESEYLRLNGIVLIGINWHDLKSM
jgi:hypothetical protein